MVPDRHDAQPKPTTSNPTLPASRATPPWAGRTLSPMLRQYVAAKEEHPDVILMFRMGDFFELFFDDAKIAAGLLDLTLTARDKGDNPVPMAGVPHHAVENYVARLVGMGHSVALCDQVEDPKARKGLVRRAITRLVTPGTLCELDALDPGRAHYLAAVVPVAHDVSRDDAAPRALDGEGGEAEGEVALVFLDLLAGEMPASIVPSSGVAEELLRMGAREVLGDPKTLGPVATTLRRAGVALRANDGPRAGGARAADDGAGDEGLERRAVLPPPPLHFAKDAEVGLSPHQCAALRQAGASALRWASHTQRRALNHVAPLQVYRLQDSLVMDEATRQNLELVATQQGGARQGSLLHHLDRCRTPPGRRLLRRWLLAPLRAPQAIARRAQLVADLVAQPDGNAQVRAALAQVRDVERLAGRVAVGRATPRDLSALGTSVAQLEAVAEAVRALAAPRPEALGVAWRHAPLPRALAATLGRALVDQPPLTVTDGGVFARGYDARLDELIALTDDSEAWLRSYEAKERARTGMTGLRVRYNRVFGYTVELSRSQGLHVPEGYVRRQTLANVERFVTPELERFEKRALTAAGERRDHEAALFTSLLAEVRGELPALAVCARLAAKTDVLASLAEVALQHRYVRPQLVDQAVLELHCARHPVLEALMPQGERFVANNIEADAAGRQLTVLTGPNMAGKSTVMRQAALCCVMAQMGGFVPASEARIGVVDRLFVRVGASDNLSRGQSTFMVEMVETATILRQATRHSLVLLDEIGRGTSTFDGLSLAWAVAEYLHDHVGCRTLFATHYHELVALCRSLPRAVAMQMRVHEAGGELVFLRQLAEGAAGRSYGIEVAKLAGVPAPVLLRARQVLAALEGQADAPAAAAGAQSEAALRLPRRTQLELFAARLPARARAEGQTPSQTRATHAAQTSDAVQPPVAAARFAAPTTASPGATAPVGDPAAAACGSVVPDGQGAALVRRLRQADLERTTPLQALELLHELQQAAGVAQKEAPRRGRGRPGGPARTHPAPLLT